MFLSSVNNLVFGFKLQPYELDKKAYKKHIMDYGKKLVDKLKADGASEEEVNAFKTKMAKKCGEIVKSKQKTNFVRLLYIA